MWWPSFLPNVKLNCLSWSLHDRRNIGKKIHDMRPEKKYQTWNSFCWLLSGGHTANTVLLVEKTKLQLCWKHQHFNFCSNKDRVLKYYFIWLNFFGIGSSRGGGEKKAMNIWFFQSQALEKLQEALTNLSPRTGKQWAYKRCAAKQNLLEKALREPDSTDIGRSSAEHRADCHMLLVSTW